MAAKMPLRRRTVAGLTLFTLFKTFFNKPFFFCFGCPLGAGALATFFDFILLKRDIFFLAAGKFFLAAFFLTFTSWPIW
jgi:hypothetical protein